MMTSNVFICIHVIFRLLFTRMRRKLYCQLGALFCPGNKYINLLSEIDYTSKETLLCCFITSFLARRSMHEDEPPTVLLA